MIRPSDYTVLIVDDVVANLNLLIDQLLLQGYQIRVAESGESALRRVQSGKPDIILMDVNMPGINGFETCRRLKTIPEMADVPVIFLTVSSDMDDKTAGFEAGGVDYITKPIDGTEVLLRIRTHLELGRLRRELARHNAELESRVADRTQELREEVDRRARSEQEREILLDVVRKQSEQLQRLTRQLVGDQNRQRHSLTEDFSRQVRQHLEPIDQQMRQLFELTQNAESRKSLGTIAGQIQALQRMLQQMSESAGEETSQEAPFHANPLLILSEREREVLMLTVNSYSTEDIARILHVTPSTVRTYRYRIMQKLDVPDDAGLVRLAVRHGLAEIG